MRFSRPRFAETALVLTGLTPVLFAAGATGFAAPQSTPNQGRTYHRAQNSTGTAANAWMRIPTLYADRSAGISASLRAERDQFWDGISDERAPLTPESAASTAVSDGSLSSTPPEIAQVPNRVILTATFMRFRSILTASERAVYTDVTFRVHEVFQVRAGHAHPGDYIDVSLFGGTVITPAGQVLSYLVQPRQFFLQPGKRYLLVLTYHDLGDFYQAADDWDISDGVVRPNSSASLRRTREGRSSLSGLATDQLPRALYGLLSESQ